MKLNNWPKWAVLLMDSCRGDKTVKSTALMENFGLVVTSEEDWDWDWQGQARGFGNAGHLFYVLTQLMVMVYRDLLYDYLLT